MAAFFKCLFNFSARNLLSMTVRYKISLTDNKRYPLVPSVRLLTAGLVMMSLFCVYACLFSLNFCITCMVNSTAVDASSTSHQSLSSNISHRRNADEKCPNAGNSSDSGYSGTLLWTTSQQSNVLSGMGYGGMAFVFVGGLLVDRTGAKRLNGAGLVLLTVTMALIPIFSKLSWVGVFVLRILQGAVHALSVPAFLVACNTWFPQRERGVLMSLSITGVSFGGLFSFATAGYFCQSSLGWEGFLYMIAIVCLCVTLLWWIFYSDGVLASPWISSRETGYIMRNRAKGMSGPMPPIPWKSLLTSGPVWAIIAINFTQFFLFYYIGDYMPAYYKEVLKLDAQKSGIFSAIPLLVQIAGRLIAGPLADVLQRYISPTMVVKLITVVSSFLPPVLLVGVTFFDCTTAYGAVICFTFAYFFHGFNIGGFLRSNSRIAPPFVGTISGISNEFDYLANLLIPYVTAALLPNRSEAEWHHTIYVPAVVCAVGATIFMILGSGEVQSWAEPKPNDNRYSITSDMVLSGMGNHVVVLPKRQSVCCEVAFH